MKLSELLQEADHDEGLIKNLKAIAAALKGEVKGTVVQHEGGPGIRLEFTSRQYGDETYNRFTVTFEKSESPLNKMTDDPEMQKKLSSRQKQSSMYDMDAGHGLGHEGEPVDITKTIDVARILAREMREYAANYGGDNDGEDFEEI